MKKNNALIIYLLLIITSLTLSYASEVIIIDDSGLNYEYNDRMYTTSHILRVSNGKLMTTSDELPRDTQEAYELFEELCAPRSTTKNFNKKISVSYNGFLTTNAFECDGKTDEGSNQIRTVQFVVTTDKDHHLKDLQINQLKATSKFSEIDPHKLSVKDGAEIAIAVAASTLASGLLAKQIYPGQEDKFLHATGGSLIAAAATLLSYYGLNVSKNQAALIGFATTVAVALLKEYAYDASHRDTHTVDIRDAQATAMGGGLGAIFIRLKFEF
ncbi:MAG: hypothetical protein EHM20_14285 [Alphaproteobacteria bacterium]|nr:MAG: hypothetical protein EHM20_14285 [Alphaproteobacteria bacterium]